MQDFRRRPHAAADAICGAESACVLLLSGCITGYEKPDIALEIPDNYRYARAQPRCGAAGARLVARLSLARTDSLIEAAQTDNLDIAAAVARVVQADAQVRVSGAPLLPAVDADGSATRSRPSQRTSTSARRLSLTGVVSRGASRRRSTTPI